MSTCQNIRRGVPGSVIIDQVTETPVTDLTPVNLYVTPTAVHQILLSMLGNTSQPDETEDNRNALCD